MCVDNGQVLRCLVAFLFLILAIWFLIFVCHEWALPTFTSSYTLQQNKQQIAMARIQQMVLSSVSQQCIKFGRFSMEYG